MKDITIRTEVVGLDVTVSDFAGGCLRVRYNGKNIADIDLEKGEYPDLVHAFSKKDEPGMNWFDTVLSTVNKSIMGTPKKEIRKQ